MSWDRVSIDVSLTKKSLRNRGKGQRIITYRQALYEAHVTALQRDKRVFIFGEGVDDPGGTFGTTIGLHKMFGKDRVFDTPICENTLTGIAIGASLAGLRPVLVHMRTDFLLISMDQIINHAAKWKYMFAGKVTVPIVIRAIIGGGWGSAAQHSQPIHALFAHIPGLKVVMPATAYDAKGLFLESIADNGPVIFIEHRWLYDLKDHVPEDSYRIPLGKAFLSRKGKDITLIANSFMVPMAMKAAESLSKEGIDVEVLDLRTIKPLDEKSIVRSVRKTRRALVLDSGYEFCGISAEIVSLISEHCFAILKQPVLRMGLPDIPTPASPVLEKLYYPNVAAITGKVKRLLKNG